MNFQVSLNKIFQQLISAKNLKSSIGILLFKLKEKTSRYHFSMRLLAWLTAQSDRTSLQSQCSSKATRLLLLVLLFSYSGSTDDDGIATYLWEMTSRPLQVDNEPWTDNTQPVSLSAMQPYGLLHSAVKRSFLSVRDVFAVKVFASRPNNDSCRGRNGDLLLFDIISLLLYSL